MTSLLKPDIKGFERRAVIAQSAERQHTTHEVTGSNPAVVKLHIVISLLNSNYIYVK